MLRFFRFRIQRLLALALTVGASVSACGGGGDVTTTEPGPATNVGFTSSAFTFTAIGASQAVTATVRDGQGRALSSAPLVWASDDASIAEVQASGRSATIIARKSGSTIVRAISGGISAPISVLVLGVRAVTIVQANVLVSVGATQQVSADVEGDAGVSRSVTWTSADPGIATISSQGVVTGIAGGSVVIRATAVADPSVSGTANVVVAPLRGVAVTPGISSVATGDTRQLTAIVAIDPGYSTSVTWSSSAPGVATVDQQGLVTGVAYGAASITATSVADLSLKGTAVVNVVPMIRQITLTTPLPQMFISQSQTLTANVTADPGLATSVTWNSSSPSIANVNASGHVTAIALGSATVTATSTADPTKKATSLINVVARPVSVSMSSPTLVVGTGTTGTLTATVAADPGVSQALTWSSQSPAIATVNNGVVTGVSPGTTQVTAMSVADPSQSASATVTVLGRLATSWSSRGLGGAMVENITSTYAINSTSAFAVNSRGDVFRYDGISWTRTAPGSSFGTTFTAVHGSGATNVVAVGSGGKIAVWNGTSWQSRTSNTTADLHDVWVESATSAFAVGAGGTAVRLSGTTWASTTTTTTENLFGVWHAGSNEWFAVGAGGETLRFSANAWLRTASNVSVTLYDVYGTAANDVYAVGEAGTILRFDGAEWMPVSTNGIGSDLFSVTGAAGGSGNLFIGGDRMALELVGGVVDVIQQPAPYETQFLSASVDASGVLWMSGERGLVMRYTGSAWQTVNFAPDLIDVWSTSPNNAWAVGEFGFIYRWNGTDWTRQASPTVSRLNTVWGISGTNAFAGGDGGIILRWDGTSWTTMTTPSTADILGLWGTSSGTVYASTFDGEVLRWNGVEWTIVTSQTSPLYAVFGTPTGDVFASGDGGTVLRFSNGTWTALNTGTTALLAGLWAGAQSNVFSVGIIGSSAAAYRYNNSTWQQLNVGTSVELTSIWGPTENDLYASGAAGTILRFDGTTWQSMNTGTNEYLWSLTGDPGGLGAAFSVGFNATLVSGSTTGSSVANVQIGKAAQRGSLEPSRTAMRARLAAGKVTPALPQGADRASLRRAHVKQARSVPVKR